MPSQYIESAIKHVLNGHNGLTMVSYATGEDASEFSTSYTPYLPQNSHEWDICFFMAIEAKWHFQPGTFWSPMIFRFWAPFGTYKTPYKSQVREGPARFA